MGRLAADGCAPRSVIEPTAGRGAFLAAAARAWPDARLVGVELEPAHAAAARALVPRADVRVGDAFTFDWRALVASLPAPVLVLGNPPWVTTATLGAHGVAARPRARPADVRGLDAVTGRSNFDVSEPLVGRLLEALEGRDAALAMILKLAVARRLAERHALGGEVRRLDARRWFGAAVDAAWVVARPGPRRWAEHLDLDAPAPARTWGVCDGRLHHDVTAFERTRALEGRARPAWRSGVKHDCALVLELVRERGGWRSRAGSARDLEPDLVYPLLKGGDLARGEGPERALLLPQHALGAPTDWIERALPATWAYLDAHRAHFERRRSRVYAGRPPFAVFGVGDYALAPWKVAVAALYPDLSFRLVGPRDGRPTLLDDTCYFLPFDTREDAERTQRILSGDPARAFFAARLFADAKRPVTKRLLDALDLERAAGA
ncbi:MAG: hypothetical protein KF729_22010 [Sandaracinaceae bacterium]|nr:hypothetical protein [Sandaracinaceae bacterium]